MIGPARLSVGTLCIFLCLTAHAQKAWRDIYETYHAPVPEHPLFDLVPLFRETDIVYVENGQLAPSAPATSLDRLQRWSSGIDTSDSGLADWASADRDNPEQPFPVYSNYAREALFKSPMTSLWSPARNYLNWAYQQHGFSSKIISLLFYHYSPDAIPGKENYAGFFGVDFYSNWVFGSSDFGVSALTFELGGQNNLNGKGKDMGENVGSLITSNVVHGDTDPIIGDIYLTQGFSDNRILVNAGRITAWYYYGYNVFTDSEVQRFSSDMFSGGVAIPEGGGNGTKPGASLQVYPNDNFYLSAVLTNTEGEDADFDFDMFNEDAYFLGLEAGYLQLSDFGLKTRYSLGLHSAKKKQDSGRRESGNGFNFMLQSELSPRGFTPYAGVFLQYAYSDPKIADVEQQLSVGININHAFHRRSDAFGLGVGTIKPSDSSRNREYFSESYYRFQLTENVQWTLNLQLFYKPSDPAQRKELVPVYGTRIYFEL